MMKNSRRMLEVKNVDDFHVEFFTQFSHNFLRGFLRFFSLIIDELIAYLPSI